MAAGFYWTDKARRSSCHRRNESVELDVFEAERYFSTATESLGHRGTALSHKIGLATRDQLGHGRASLDMPAMMLRHTHHPPQDTFLDTLNPPKDKKKHKSPSSPGGKLASFFNSLISQTVSKKKKQSKSSPQSVKDLVEEESPSGWRRRRRSSISHFGSSASSTAASFSAAFVSRKPNTATPRAKRTSMSDIESKSIEPCPSISGIRTPPPYLVSTPIKAYKHTNIIPSAKVQNGGASLDWLDEKFKLVKGLSEKRSSRDFERHVVGSEKRGWVERSSSQESKEFKRFVEEDGGESDSSSDLFELKLNYDHHLLGYCGGGLPVYESTHMDSIKISSGTPITNGPFRNI